ncbi:hypothetical protein Hanom_Chr14g01263781 [Helianthus anomalus]
MMIDDQVTDLPKDPADVMNFRNMTSDTLKRLNQYKLKKEETKPMAKHIICNIANPRYVAPENDAWRHDNRPSKKSPPRLVDELVIDPSEVLQQGVGLLKDSFEGYLKKNKEAQAEKAPKKVETSAKHVELEGVVHSDSSDADDESTDTEPEIDMAKVGHGKVQLKKKPQKKRKGSDEEDSKYMPTAEEKKKLRTKRKAVRSGVIPRNVRAKKGGAPMPESQSGKSEKHIATSKGPETAKVQNVQVPKAPEVQSVEKTEVVKEKAPESPEYLRIEKKGADDAESSRPEKTTLPDRFEGFPNVHGEYTNDILLNDEYNMFHDVTVKDLKKKVSILDKEKDKAEADHDELKKQLEELTKANEEIKNVVVKYAKKINTLEEDVDDNAKLFKQLSAELFELHVNYTNKNETNQMLHQMLQELHEVSASEIKVLKLEIEALRADKTVKDEQLNMLYTVMEHHPGINVQSIYNSLEIQMVEERRAQREKELAEEATRKRKELIVETQEAGGSSSQPDVEMVDAEDDQAQGFVLVGGSTPLSYSFDDIIRLVRVEQRKQKTREPEVKLLCWKEEEKEEEEDEELEDVLDVVDNYDPSWDDLIDKDDDEDQGSMGLIVIPSIQQSLDDFLNDEINEQEEDHHQ